MRIAGSEAFSAPRGGFLKAIRRPNLALAMAKLLTERELERELARTLDRPVEVRFGDARRTVVHAAVRKGTLVVRLNAFFAAVPEDVLAALAVWLRSGRAARRACRLLDAWIDQNLERLQRESPRAVRLCTAGRHHDLAPMTESLHAREFAGVFAPPERPRVTWGRAARSRSRHTLRLGSYDPATRVVRIHPVLDQPLVPDWFVRFILFHEHLHAELDPQSTGGDPAARAAGRRRRHHGPEFRRRESAHPDCARALAWERRHVRALIRSARRRRVVAPARRPTRATKPAGWTQRRLFPDG
jgi:hypothetical protein